MADLFMEEFEVRALSTAPHTPTCGQDNEWYFCHPEGKTQPTTITTHQLIGPTYTFHHRGTKPRWSRTITGHFGFPGPSNTLITNVYGKPTHRDQYLHWNSNHFVTAKNSLSVFQIPSYYFLEPFGKPILICLIMFWHNFDKIPVLDLLMLLPFPHLKVF